MPDARMNLWLQRLSLTAMVLLALTLVGVGVALYGPHGANESPSARSSVSR